MMGSRNTRLGQRSTVRYFRNTVKSQFLILQSECELTLAPDLDPAQLERKIRLLSLTTLAFQNIGRDLSYSAIADVLHVEPSLVERWVIDGKSSSFEQLTIASAEKVSSCSPSHWPRLRQALADEQNFPCYPRFLPSV